ncbi:drug/metabolite exporter YedA [Parachitinimonas caeni]|uniref:Drug/metabolite exporter YedA n=1 Tax=Parachitinimonas caeni TaxID=3031301 RepID=A0ABT7DVI3_9NEIS|nr:drug/metabolite exporter YedA [Parachitinimonas caeni]MDK2123113.1 drug/metabolite exporter YedA [Parachitinimonas caeni]
MSNRLLIPLCLAATYLIWGSTYLGIKWALESFPPLTLAGIRFVVAGLLMLAWARLSGLPWPSLRQLRNAAWVGFMMLTFGNGAVCIAEKNIASGVAALIVALTPLATVLMSLFWGVKARRIEWAGIAVGFAGIVLLNLDGNLRAEPFSVGLVVAACIVWGLASAWMPRLDMPQGPMSSAMQMLAGGIFCLPLAWLNGESVPTSVTFKAGAALVYLIVAGSMLAYSAYIWLLKHTRPALATSSCYANPVVALLLGVFLAQEAISAPIIAGMLAILSGVVMLGVAQSRART